MSQDLLWENKLCCTRCKFIVLVLCLVSNGKYKTIPLFYRWSDVHGSEIAQDYPGEPHLEKQDCPGTAVQWPAPGDNWRKISEGLHLSHSASSSLKLCPKIVARCHYTHCITHIIHIVHDAHTPHILSLSFDHQSSHLWDVTLIPSPLTHVLFLQAVCIENSCLVRGSKEGSNGALHLMRTLLKPAENTMFEILTENGGFK